MHSSAFPASHDCLKARNEKKKKKSVSLKLKKTPRIREVNTAAQQSRNVPTPSTPPPASFLSAAVVPGNNGPHRSRKYHEPPRAY
jgi:hypothetical protein